MLMRRTLELLGAAAALTIMACGDGSTTPTPNPGGSSGGATIAITSNGLAPRNVVIERGAQVTFVNNDGRPHDIRSDPHPGHGDCPEIHDETDPSNGSLQGTVRIQ
jgi:plastocyanin